VEDSLELAEESQGVDNVGLGIKVVVDVVLEHGIDIRDIDVEFNEITIEAIFVVSQKLVVQSLEVLNTTVEDAQDLVNSFQIVLFEGLELLLCLEKINKLLESSLEEVKASENLLGVEIELSGLWHALETLLGELVLSQVGLVELEALLEDDNKVFSGNLVFFPKNTVVTSCSSTLLLLSRCLGSCCFLSVEVQDVVLAVHDHLVGDLDEETGHSFVSVVVSSYGVDHLDGVHQNRESFDDREWGSIVEGFDVAFKSQQILDVVLSFVELFGNSELDGTPVGDGEVDATISVSVLLVS
jgi:hypothetical protein